MDGGCKVAFDQVGLGLDVGEDHVLAVVGILVEFGFLADWHDVERAR